MSPSIVHGVIPSGYTSIDFELYCSHIYDFFNLGTLWQHLYVELLLCISGTFLQMTRTHSVGLEANKDCFNRIYNVVCTQATV